MADAFRSTMTLTCPATNYQVTLEPAPMPPSEDGEIEFDCPSCGTHHLIRFKRYR